MTSDNSVSSSHLLWPTVAGCIVLLIFLRYGFSSSSETSKNRQLPPGPKPKYLIGNLLDMPPPGANMQEFWTKHKELYGGISSLTMFGKSIIVINDPLIAHDLLEKRSSKYSNRPVMHMLGTVVGLEEGLVLVQPGRRFREMRRVAHGQLGSLTDVAKWKKEIDDEVCRYLFNVLEDPQNFYRHLRRESGTIILKITYGYDVNPDGEDPLVNLAEQVLEDIGAGSVPGAFLVDVVPALLYVPAWFPGAGFKKIGQIWQERLRRFAKQPYEFTKKQVLQDSAPVSIVSESIKRQETLNADAELNISWAGAAMYGGGADTTVAQMEMFYLAMLLNPDVLRKAQQEIDTAIGNKRLPDENDRARLPYVEALLKESIRWESIFELIVPHAAAEDDTYNGYFIPQGSTMLVHLCGIYQDPSIYKDPMEFKPERYLGPNPELNPFEVIWGYGKRICPGRHLAVWNLWLQMSRTIACFDINVVPGHPPLRKFTTGLVRRPVPLNANITPRSAQHEELIRSRYKEVPTPKGDGHLLT